MTDTAKRAAEQGVSHRLPQRCIGSVPPSSWPQHLQDLKRFRKEHGHCNVPGEYPPNPPLGSWVHWIRQQKKAGKLTKERIGCLEELGFRWALRRRSAYRLDWDVMLAALIAFRERYGHCNVSTSWPDDPRLGHWVVGLRRRKRKGQLDRRQIAQLNRLGVIWEPTRPWSDMYAALAEYKRVHGDCNVPTDWPENPYLRRWIRWQRLYRKANSLEQGRIEQLDKLGFIWSFVDELWESRYSALVKFRKAYGHCRVSTLSKTHASLGNWVRRQRVMKRQGKLSAERIQRLDLLGFTWQIRQSRSRHAENASSR
jgi:hypothetical protein